MGRKKDEWWTLGPMAGVLIPGTYTSYDELSPIGKILFETKRPELGEKPLFFRFSTLVAAIAADRQFKTLKTEATIKVGLTDLVKGHSSVAHGLMDAVHRAIKSEYAHDQESAQRYCDEIKARDQPKSKRPPARLRYAPRTPVLSG